MRVARLVQIMTGIPTLMELEMNPLAMTLFALLPCTDPGAVSEVPQLGTLQRAVVHHVLEHREFPRFAAELELAEVEDGTVIFQMLGPDQLLMIETQAEPEVDDDDDEAVDVRLVPIEVTVR